MFTQKVALHHVIFGLFSAFSLAAANVSHVAQASDFDTILSCDDEAVILQTNTAERRNYQVVLKTQTSLPIFSAQERLETQEQISATEES